MILSESFVLQKFRLNFLSILESLKEENDEEDSCRVLTALEHLILSDILSLEEQRFFVDDPENAPYVARVRKLNAFVDGCIEKTFSQGILERRMGDLFLHANNPFFHPYLDRFNSLGNEETALLGISSRDRVLFIGGGAFPITAIHYARKAGCQVFCVEKMAERMEVAKQVIQALELENRVEILLAEGQKIDCASYDAIVVGVLAIPKKEIIANILRTAKRGVRILCRTTVGLREMLCAPLKEEETLSLKEKRRILGTANQTLTSILFTQ